MVLRGAEALVCDGVAVQHKLALGAAEESCKRGLVQEIAPGGGNHRRQLVAVRPPCWLDRAQCPFASVPGGMCCPCAGDPATCREQSVPVSAPAAATAWVCDGQDRSFGTPLHAGIYAAMDSRKTAALRPRARRSLVYAITAPSISH